MGIITIRLTELVDIAGLGTEDIEKIASRLVRQVLIRERAEDGLLGLHVVRGQRLRGRLARDPIEGHRQTGRG